VVAAAETGSAAGAGERVASDAKTLTNRRVRNFMDLSSRTFMPGG
jgi:hypothetical protein